MFYYLFGKVVFINEKTIVIEVNNIAYELEVKNTSKYEIDQFYKVFVFTVIKDDEQYYIGFSSIDERNLFLKLLKINNLGPKTALTILRADETEKIEYEINHGNMLFFKKIRGVKGKVAEDLIKGLSPKKEQKNGIVVNVISALKKMGFKSLEIDEAFYRIELNAYDEQTLLKECLTKLKELKNE